MHTKPFVRSVTKASVSAPLRGPNVILSGTGR